MSWKLEISLRNNTDSDVMCVIPRGQVFENKMIGTRRQNVATEREYRLIIPATSRLTVEVDVLCINRSLSPPAGMAGNMTIYQIDRAFKGQQGLWQIMSQPSA